MNIIISGGTRGIGKEVVICLAKNENNHILVTGRNEKALKILAKKFTNVRSLAIDISEFDLHSEIFRQTVSLCFNKVDIIINLAGLLISKEFTEFSNDEARSIMETNFFGPASLIRTVRPLMSKGSHIVNISSMGGFQGSQKFSGLSYYSASKAALSCLSECLALEFSGSGISVNCLALGAVQTEMLNEAFPGYKAPVSSKEMAEYICGFALNGNKYFNGKVIPVAVTNP
jgi:3-oxoacyl-[acyl-carrier protein] reductase